MPFAMPLIIRITFALAVVEGLRTRERPLTAPKISGGDLPHEAYNFDTFVREFGRVYVAGSEEYDHRHAMFQESFLQINAENARRDRSWTAGVHPFMDWTAAERTQRLHGYEPRSSRRWAETSETLVALQLNAETGLDERRYGDADDSFEADAPAVHNQGGLCGSCWAFAAVGAVEAQLMKASSPWQHKHIEPKLSVQALLDCVRNPKHCGGTGGCDGATPELAFDYMRDHGVPLDTDLSYHPLLTTDKCPVDPYPTDWQRVTIAGWRSLPRNQAQPMMQALVKEGPVVVAADARDWYPYKSGIFDGCGQDAIPNHSVMARGYGAAGGKKYWLIQNSWGTKWGESGLIRLVRHDDEDSWCGTDSKPQEGVGCDEDANKNFTVCGTCGLLFDVVVPQMGQVVTEQPSTIGSGVHNVVEQAPQPEDDEPAAGVEATASPPTPTDVLAKAPPAAREDPQTELAAQRPEFPSEDVSHADGQQPQVEVGRASSSDTFASDESALLPASPLTPTDVIAKLPAPREVSHTDVTQRSELVSEEVVPSPSLPQQSPMSLSLPSSSASSPLVTNWRDPFSSVYERTEGASVSDASPASMLPVSHADAQQPQVEVSRASSSGAFASDEAAPLPQHSFFSRGYADFQEKVQTSKATSDMDAYLRR